MFLQMKTAAAMAALFALAGCLGDTATLPTAPVPDGTAANPYILPDLAPTGSTAGLEDLYAAAPGYWDVAQTGAYQDASTDTSRIERIAYDSATDQWEVAMTNSAGTVDRVLAFDGTGAYFGQTGWYVDETSATDGAYLRVFDNDPITSQYGTFALLRDVYVDGTGVDVATLYASHYGMRTDPANLSGTATYVLQYDVLVDNYQGVKYATGGTSTINVDFDSGSLTSLGGVTAKFADGDWFFLNVTGQVSGNTITGTATGSHGYTVNHPDIGPYPAYIFYDVGTLDGAFYGPAGEEAAGTFSLESTTDNSKAVGGFWGQKL
ncbi:MAG: transferrin-binding protein-like solute binding protein [Alphaproteobacteria bacterium]|nr:transferrin-binding protein-like solute binding protein [Alphaproteobacteria bacterium]